MPDIYIIRCYRREPGDVGVPDIPMAVEDFAAAEDLVGKRLLSHFKDDQIPPRRKPNYADMIDAEGNVSFKLLVDLDGKVKRDMAFHHAART